jgi:hypothetical protein
MSKSKSSGRGAGANSPPTGEPWVWIPRSVLINPGFLRLSVTAWRVLGFLLEQHVAHGGKENGRLMCPYNQLSRRGCSRHAISGAMEELQSFGFVKFTKGARQSGRPGATKARITFYKVDGALGSATNDYKRNTLESIKGFNVARRAQRLKVTAHRKARRSKPAMTLVAP